MLDSTSIYYKAALAYEAASYVNNKSDGRER